MIVLLFKGLWFLYKNFFATFAVSLPLMYFPVSFVFMPQLNFL